MAELQLYVWTEFCPDDTDGLAFAIAASEELARAAVIASHGYEPDVNSWGKLYVHKIRADIAYSVEGGG